ncbi:hypothetical protein DAA51_36760 [Bradyrhizobium sp. WBAH10]|nr:hypothetical protein [Bradyrhizobium sp. WBAH30]MDD1543449.1 hypothetical protein [Bradyrhizobium sp. WBAH41]MDD1557579.1 hypothetical protein [Bradyrhizobium sp. WBAH23]MDD1564991.1 hypothetical protein [Bradyrhizobium sp. WBAH33]MDD1590399.1 hypothetical protein [Bradyrhizobium sp. WBAH42]NRB88106.1 hypothetical protein [Bradyrhizobium sp. WBAH10]QCJ93431.1 hypothetical protein DAA57_37005 [Bradyrhizobium yuanmingense]
MIAARAGAVLCFRPEIRPLLSLLSANSAWRRLSVNISMQKEEGAPLGRMIAHRWSGAMAQGNTIAQKNTGLKGAADDWDSRRS